MVVILKVWKLRLRDGAISISVRHKVSATHRVNSRQAENLGFIRTQVGMQKYSNWQAGDIQIVDRWSKLPSSQALIDSM